MYKCFSFYKTFDKHKFKVRKGLAYTHMSIPPVKFNCRRHQTVKYNSGLGRYTMVPILFTKLNYNYLFNK